MASPTDVWHDHYDDSDGDLVLVSKDGVKFRTYSALIAKSTSFFKLLDGHILPPSDSSGRVVKAFRLDHETLIITHFLDYASVSSPILTTQYDDSVKLLGLADHVQAQKLIIHVKQRLEHNIEDGHRAADLFLLASRRDDWAMGRAAIRKLDKHHVEELKKKLGGYRGFFNKLRPAWRQTLIDLIFFELLNGERHNRVGWERFSERFVAPDRNTEKRKFGEEDDAPLKRVKPEES